MGRGIFKSGNKSSFAKNSRRMARMVSIGGGSLAIVFCLFIFFYFESNEFVRNLSCVLPIIYLGSIVMSFTKVTNKTLYNIIFYIYIFSSLIILFIAYQLAFDAALVILMLTVYNIILFAIPKPNQLLIYFGVIFVPLVFAILFSDISVGLTLLILVSFAYVFLLSYVIAQQKQKLNLKSIQNSEVLKTLVNNANDSIVLVDSLSKNIWDTNDKTKDIFGLDNTEEIISKNYYYLFSDDKYIPKNRNEITQQIAQFGYFQSEVLFKKKDESVFWGDMLLSPFKAANNNYYLIQIKNIDSKKKYDDRLLANNEKFKFILDNLEESIYLINYVDKNKKVFEFVSPYTEKIFGLTKSEYISSELRNRLNDMYHPDDLITIKVLKEELMRSKDKVSTTYRIKPVDKIGYLTLHETVIPKLNKDGEIEQVLGIIREVKADL